MTVYWSMILWTGFIGFFNYRIPKYASINNIIEKRTRFLFAFLSMAYIIFFAGMRSGVGDTPAYLLNYQLYPNNLSSIVLKGSEKDVGFIYFTVFIKQYISPDFQVWLFTIAAISGFALMIPLFKYSLNYPLSIFIFITSVQFTWLFNGMRQFLVATILFSCMDLIVRKKIWVFIIIVLALSVLHMSCLIMIPVFFIVQSKPWSKQMKIVIAVMLAAVVFSGSFSNMLYALMENTQYQSSIDYMKNDTGANVIRALIAMVPAFLAFRYRKGIEALKLPYINICVNMSVIAAGIYAIASVTSGVFFTRLAIYAELYNLILLPWLLNKLFLGKNRFFITTLCILAYLVFFYIQMMVTWKGLEYVSKSLGLRL